VDYFSFATSPRFRGATRSIFAPAFTSSLKRCETCLKKTLAFSEIALYNAQLVIAAVKSGRDEGEEDDGWFADYSRRQAVFCPSRIA
jgi:hypothetical protein